MRLSRVGCVSVLSASLLLPLAVGCNPSNTGNDPDMGRDLTGVVMPTLESVTPNQAVVKGGTEITLVGTGFQAGTTVKIGGVAAQNVNVLSRILLKATVPAYTGAPGPVDILVENPDGGKASRSDLFSFVRVQVTFAQAMTRTSGNSPVAIAAEDINGDGGRELLVANYDDNNVTVLLNNQNFMSIAGPYSTGVFPTAIAIADINGDTYKDIVTSNANAGSNDVSVLRGVGNGAFLAPTHFAVGMTATGIVARDFTGDGKVDLAVSIRTLNKIFVMTNNGTAGNVPSFMTPYTSYDVGAGPAALVLADVTRDSRDDLIAANYTDNQVGVLVGAAGGAFTTPVRSAPVGTNPIAIVAGDLNGDSNIDVISANFTSNNVSILRGNGDGSFMAPTTIQTAEKPTAVAIADIDQDTKADVVIANSGQNQIWIMLGKGDGTYEPTQIFLVGQQPWGLVVADLNGDGKPDIATANRGSDDVTILLNQTQR